GRRGARGHAPPAGTVDRVCSTVPPTHPGGDGAASSQESTGAVPASNDSIQVNPSAYAGTAAATWPPASGVRSSTTCPTVHSRFVNCRAWSTGIVSSPMLWITRIGTFVATDPG